MTKEQREKILENFGGDSELVKSSYESFSNALPSLYAAVQNALASRQSKELYVALHTLKGAISNFLCEECVEMCKKLESFAKTENFEAVNDNLPYLVSQTEILKKFMTTWVQELDRPSTERTVTEQDATILVIDDSEFQGAMLCKRLQSQGYKTLYLTSGKGILSFLEQNSVDVILLDLILKDSSGLDVLKEIRTKHNEFELPVLINTSAEDNDALAEAFAIGANDYLLKPLNLQVANARLKSQISLSKIYRASLLAQELETVHSMIVTYNHEINNPLTIAMGFVSREIKGNASPNLQKAMTALERIQKIVEQIAKIDPTTQKNDYMGKSQLYKVR